MTDSKDMEARSQALAKSLLEAMDGPCDDAREAEKDAADRAALEAFYERTGQRSHAASAALRLADRVARDVPSEGAFEPIDEIVSERVALRVGTLASEPSAGRYVRVRVETESGGTVSWQFIARGTRDELVAKLRSSSVGTAIDDAAARLTLSQRQQALP